MRSGNSMIYLKEANMADAQKEYEFITQLLEDDIYMSVHKNNLASLKTVHIFTMKMMKNIIQE